MRRAFRSLCLAIAATLAPVAAVTGAEVEPIEIRLELSDRSQLEQLSRLVSVYDVRGKVAFAVASPGQLERLAEAGFRWQSVARAAAAEVEMCPTGWEFDPGRSWDCYPSYGQYVDFLEGMADDHPALCRLVDLGATSNQIRPHRLWALRISDNPELEEAEPEVLLSSTMHGDEASGFVLMLRLIHELLTEYGSDPEISDLVDSFEIWINPLANPDGTYFTADDTVNGAIRYYTTSTGANSWVDANRNFPDPDEGDHPDENPWWPETQAMMAFAESHSITLSANLHDGVEVVNYPWDTWSRRHVEDALLIHISRAYADLAQADGPPGYMTDFSNGITNGWDWFPVAGGRQDFMTFWHSDREVTIELSETKTPAGDVADQMWSWNRRALLGFMAQAGIGIHGVITGAGGEPLDATIEVVGLDSALDNSYVRTDPDVGDYHRMLLPGSYTLRISSGGHDEQIFEDVVVAAQGPTLLDAVLQPTLVTLEGQVRTPASRLPIAGATVELIGTGRFETTAADGSFSFAEVAVADYDLRVTASDFETIERSITVTASPTRFELLMPPLSFAPITVMEAENSALGP
jgi:hypothetical protein